ncbi:MAG TPA: 50S ribosomal protein L34e [Candidatus Nanoarchaeia archaeon]|nr:hypothetical protein [uncultured archaeon]AQS34188.1 hypothetical protein [uncultured archaeon]HLC56566.1 50S ribosomal protein L34e [Candidatus Nanoarchaeia archaeon]
MRPSKQKSRTLRRIKVKTPGGKVVMHYKARMPKGQKCANCKKTLQGIPRLNTAKFRNLPSSSKKAKRPFANLCSSCMRLKIKELARK